MRHCALLIVLATVVVQASSPSGRNVEIAPGVMMPSVNLGTTIQSDPQIGIPTWLKAGGVGIDNDANTDQPEIAKLISGRPRSAYFMTSKIETFGSNVPKVLTAAYALQTVEEYVKTLGIAQLDLVVIHQPSEEPSYNQALWKGLEQAVAKNLTRAIGLSNFPSSDIETILRIATIRPAVNQCFLRVGSISSMCGLRDSAIAYNQAQNITFEAWGVLRMCPVTNPDIIAIAKAHGKTTQQVCLRWILDRGCTLTVGTGKDSVTAEQYAKEDLDIFEFRLTSEEITTLNGI